tara:strand:+ start:8647 stop:8838 length:192 start_codon:yes stop_codon:yes gene_type:complete
MSFDIQLVAALAFLAGVFVGFILFLPKKDKEIPSSLYRNFSVYDEPTWVRKGIPAPKLNNTRK